MNINQKCILWTLLSIVCLKAFVDSYEMNMTKYFSMPHLYNIDDYDRCLEEFHNYSTYCFVRAEVIEQTDSIAWTSIVDISKYTKHHFDHRHLYFGLCVRWCENALRDINQTDLDNLYGGLLNNNSKVNTYLQLFSTESTNRQRFNRLLNQCINLSLGKNYNLTAKSVVEYCNTNQDVVKQDTWDYAFYSVLCAFIVLVILSTIYDFYIKKNRPENKNVIAHDHYKWTPNNWIDRICVIFSVPRNWHRLNEKPNGKTGLDLRFLDCLKFFSMFLVIFAHTTWIVFEGAISNPQDTERMLHSVVGTLFIGGSLITTTFFVISGFLLTLSWLAVARTKDRFSFSTYIILFVKFNVFRYIRLTAPYAVVIFLSGVNLENPGGPFWRHIYEREQLSCRKNWWTNLLYVNNYVNNNERCMLQSWYLAADTHSFVLALILLMVGHRWPQIRNKLFSIVFLVFYILPGLLTYLKQYSPLMIASPQIQKDSFIGNRDFDEFYTPFHMNFGSYLSGVITALIYDYISTLRLKLYKFKSFHIFWYALFPLGLVWILSAHPLLQTYYAKPPLIWGSIFAAMQRTSWAIGAGVVIIGMSAKIGWIFTEFASLHIFRLLGRLSYGAFIIHLIIGRFTLAGQRQPIFFNPNTQFAYVMLNVIVSYMCSFILIFLIELPVSAILKFVR